MVVFANELTDLFYLKQLYRSMTTNKLAPHSGGANLVENYKV
jgi:hypothetical protein